MALFQSGLSSARLDEAILISSRRNPAMRANSLPLSLPIISKATDPASFSVY